jgi:hypothetical protein
LEADVEPGSMPSPRGWCSGSSTSGLVEVYEGRKPVMH